MKTIISIISIFLVCTNVSLAVSGNDLITKIRAEGEKQKREIDAATKIQKDAARIALKTQQDAIAALNASEQSKTNLMIMSAANAAQVIQLNDAKDELEKAQIDAKNQEQELDLKIEKLDVDNEKLQNQKWILFGSTLGFLITTIFTGSSALRNWRSSKLEDEKLKLEIEKLRFETNRLKS